MSCAACEQRTTEDLANVHIDLPFNATDILAIDRREVRPLVDADWPTDKHKLLVFFPEIFTPVCQSELGALNQWASSFAELGCVIIAVCSDPALAIKDWYEQEPLLTNLDCLTFSSYLLPSRLGLVEGGRAKRSSVFVMQDGTTIKQEHFHKVGRSFAELHRMLYGYTTDSYCAEGWTSPADDSPEATSS